MAGIKVVASYQFGWQAALACNELSDAAIWCRTEDALAVANLGLPSSVFGGIKVVVHEEDLERAHSILSGERFAHSLEGHGIDDESEPEFDEDQADSKYLKCPECNSDQYELGPQFHYTARGAIVLGIALALALGVDSLMFVTVYLMCMVIMLFIFAFILKAFPLECRKCGYVGPRKTFVGKRKLDK